MKDLTKRKPIRSKAIRQSANGESCTVCDKNDDTTVFCHLNELYAGKGISQKADDFGFFACQECHDIYDGRVKGAPILYWHLLRACYRTWRRLIDKGILKITDYEP